jgi:hypothetical protein
METSDVEPDHFVDSVEPGDDEKKLAELRRIIMIGIAEADAGLVAPYSYEQMMLDLKNHVDDE